MGEPKIDGARALVHFMDGEVVITSRRAGVDGTCRQWQENLPHLVDNFRMQGLKGYWLFDGELTMTDLSSTMSVVGANAAQAIAYQEANGRAQLQLFDLLVHHDQDITGETLENRYWTLHNSLDWAGSLRIAHHQTHPTPVSYTRLTLPTKA